MVVVTVVVLKVVTVEAELVVAAVVKSISCCYGGKIGNCRSNMA